eukprot:3461916-Pyramimonas_sp.AAC.1
MPAALLGSPRGVAAKATSVCAAPRGTCAAGNNSQRGVDWGLQIMLAGNTGHERRGLRRRE